MPVPMERGAPVGILDSFERGLERVVNGAFAKTFKSGLQPLEVTAALRRELDTKAAVVARDRILADPGEVVRRAPDIILGSWCGKKFRPERVAARPGWDAIPAVRDGELHEIKSPIILQPGPAAVSDGVDALHRVIAAWSRR